MTHERYIITRTHVTTQTRLCAAEPLGVRLTVFVEGSPPMVPLMSISDANEEEAIRRLSAQIVLEFTQGKFRVAPSGLPLGIVYDQVLAALSSARVKRNADRDRALHYISILNDEIGAMRRSALIATMNAEAGGIVAEPGTGIEPDAASPTHHSLIELNQLAAAMAFPPPAPHHIPLLSRRRESDITDGLQPPPVVQPYDGLTGDPVRDAVRRRWQAVAHVGALTAPDGRLILWSANHADLAIKMAKQDRRWWEIGAVGKPTHDFIRDAFARWVVSREGRRVEAFEQLTIDKIWDPYCRFMVSDASAAPPAPRAAAEAAAVNAEDLAEEEAPHHDE